MSGKRPKEQRFNAPFAEVAKALKKQLEKQAPAKAPPPPPKPKPNEDQTPEQTFAQAMAGTAPLNRDQRGRAHTPAPPRAEDLPVHDEEAEVLAQLASLVEGNGHFDIADSDEFIEGGVEGLDRRILRALRRGDYAIHGHLDLHGLTRDPARDAVERFLVDAKKKSWHCVLIVHGRGLHSKDNIPVLKGFLQSWLGRGRIARHILAFCTARPHDGGAGAVYVLLRR